MTDEQQYKNLSLDEIIEPNTAARQTIDEDKFYELAASIKLLGVIEPIIVKRQGDKYQIIAGHRRFLASQKAGLAVIPAIISDDTDAVMHAKRIHENLIREDLNPYDLALYIKQLKEDKLMTHQAIADMFNKSLSWVTQHLAILEMDQELKDAVESGRISYLVGLEIMKVSSPQRKLFLLDQVIVGDASLRIVRGWVTAALIEEGRKPAQPSEIYGPGAPAEIQKMVIRCSMHGENVDANQIIQVALCPNCFTIIMEFFRAWRNQEKNGTAVSPSPGPVLQNQPG